MSSGTIVLRPRRPSGWREGSLEVDRFFFTDADLILSPVVLLVQEISVKH